MRGSRRTISVIMGMVMLSGAPSLSLEARETGAAGQSAADRYPDGRRRWTASDSVSLRQLTRQGIGVGADDVVSREGDDVLWSPDRSKFLFVTHRGDIACDCLRYTLSVYDALELGRVLRSSPTRRLQPAPMAEVSFETHSSYEFMAGISEPRWIDAGTILFVGNRSGFRQLFRLSAATGALVQLTNMSDAYDPDAPAGDDRTGQEGGVTRYAIDDSHLFFSVGQVLRRSPLVAAYPSVSVADERLINLHFRTDYTSSLFQASARGDDVRRVTRCLGAQVNSGDLVALSADGRWAVFPCRRLAGDNVASADPAPAFWLLDTLSGDLRRISALAPSGPYRVAWRGDGEQLAILGAVLSEPGCGGGGAQSVVVLNLPANQPTCFTPGQGSAAGGPAMVSDLRWNSADELVVNFLARAPARPFVRTYSLQGGQWRAGAEEAVPPVSQPPSPSAQTGLAVRLEESANLSWSIVAAAGRGEAVLTSADGGLDQAWRQPVREISWREGDFIVRGGLVLPRDRRPGARLPLVIQAGQHLPDQFLPDGSATTIFAAQALAAQGMAVLNISILPEAGQRGRRRNEDVFRERIDAIVAALSDQGLIDRERVGLTGFSQTGYQAHYLATHPGRTRLAAVIAADSWTASYGAYTFLDEAAQRSSYLVGAVENAWGGPFWENRQGWVENAPLFNLQNIEAPILFEMHNTRYAMPAMAETVGAYRLAHKPFEYFLFPSAVHQLRRPRERMASMNNNIAWMAFWLQGREIPGLQDAETYARWRQLRALRDRNDAARRATPDADSPAVADGRQGSN